MPKNKLDVAGAEQAANRFKEEMAEEFGMFRSSAEREAITPKIIKEERENSGK
ncbi:hypothetical protein ACFFJY_11480 [Fictibacillus aquaticus]|uniref:hypothetical protein n=1 Tax=Fictibacillus aquaticus TaxID=2021314 RepID=UPI0013FD1FB2|nr:hypothetical protein [Fictibacillus aquaticus]